MKSSEAVSALSALAHQHRLNVYRTLVEAGPEGLNAGAIAARLKIPPSSLTFHLQHLHRAGLVTQERRSRELVYAADFAKMGDLMAYLTENCCGEAASAMKVCCEPATSSRKSARKSVKVA